MPQTILYYPNININDGIWLRNALLYWDKISSIVPYEGYEDLSEDLLYLQKSNVYSPIFPEDLFNSEFVTEFCDTIEKRILQYEKAKNINQAKFDNITVKIHKDKIYAPALYDLINYSKLPDNILKHFKDNKYISDCDANGFMRIDKKIASIYMRTLAEYSIKCSDKDMVLGTDKANSSREIYNNNFGRSKSQCCMINIVDCLPAPSSDTSFEDILNFKIARKDELNAFRSKIRELEESIYRSASVEEIKHYENKFVESWRNCHNDYQKVLKEAKIKFALTNFCTWVAIPLFCNILSSRFGININDIFQIGNGALQTAISYIDYKDKISPHKTDGGFNYIIKASKNGLINL